MNRYFLVASLVLVLFSPEIVHSQATASAELYLEGKLAYEKGDCVTAIEKLSAFKAKNEDKIESHKLFFGLIDEKIANCKVKLLSRESSGATSGVTGGAAGPLTID